MKTRGGLIIPPNVSSVDPPKFFCTVCPATFTADEGRAYERHVVRCAASHEEELHNASPRVQAPGIMGDEGIDLEYRDYLRRRKNAG